MATIQERERELQLVRTARDENTRELEKARAEAGPDKDRITQLTKELVACKEQIESLELQEKESGRKFREISEQNRKLNGQTLILSVEKGKLTQEITRLEGEIRRLSSLGIDPSAVQQVATRASVHPASAVNSTEFADNDE